MKKLFITGGAGYLGRNIVERYYGKMDITVFSRDESKHYYLQKDFPDINCIVGDIRNYDLLKRASKDHDYAVFAASMKQIGAVDQNSEEAIKVIVDGAVNSRRVAEENNMIAATFISTDKSRAATTLYGAMKFVAGESFIVNAERSKTRLNTLIYGNVTNSTGSIIPLIWNRIKNNKQLTLYSEEMTRFMIDIDDAVDLVDYSLFKDEITGYNIIPEIPSYKVKDLVEIFAEDKGLKHKVGTPRISEKIHEIMISEEEQTRVYSIAKSNMDISNYYLMHYKNIVEAYISDALDNGDSYIVKPIKKEAYSSKDYAVTKEQLREYLKERNYYE
jgi:UDP-glucose 4-epimerase